MGKKAMGWAVVAAVLVLCGGALCSWAQEPQPTTESQAAESVGQEKVYDPANTKVVVLPFVNGLGKEGPEEKAACQMGTQQLRAAFADRSFVALEEAAVSEALAKLGIELSDSEERTKESFQKIAEELKADLVVCGVLQGYKTYMQRQWLASRKRGEAKIEMKVYDARDQAYRVKAVQVGTAKGSPLEGGLARSRGLREDALTDAVSKSIDAFLKPYPVKKTKQGTG